MAWCIVVALEGATWERGISLCCAHFVQGQRFSKYKDKKPPSIAHNGNKVTHLCEVPPSCNAEESPNDASPLEALSEKSSPVTSNTNPEHKTEVHHEDEAKNLPETSGEMDPNELRKAEEYKNRGNKRPSTAPSYIEIKDPEDREGERPASSPNDSAHSANIRQQLAFERHFKQYERVVSNGEVVEFRICKLILMGPPRVGKTSFILRLLGDKLPEYSPSTPVAESPRKAVIHSMEANTTVLCEAGEKVLMTKLDSPAHEFSFWLSHIPVEQEDQSPMPEVVAKFCFERVDKHNNSDSQMKEIMRDATEKSNMASLGKVVDLIQLNIIDTGGQPEFHEVLPLLVNGPAIYALAFKANDSIKKPYKIVYEFDDKTKCQTYQTNLTTEQVLLKAIAGIQSFTSHKSTHPKLRVNAKSAVVLIATHCNSKDGLSEDERSKEIKDLNEAVKESFDDFTGTDAKDRVFKIDNKSPDEDDFVRFRTFLKNAIEERVFTVKLPPQWLTLYFMLQREKKQYMNIAEVEGIAYSLKIPDMKDLKAALWVLHHYTGSIMYFEDVETLRDIVFLDTQLIFDCVTAILVEVFVPTNTTILDPVQTFQDTGRFKMEDFKRILRKNKQKINPGFDLELIIHLLKHMHILSDTRDEFYFLPCVLKSDEVHLPSAKDIHTKPPLLIRFTSGTNPFGVFFSTVNHLITNFSNWKLVACDDGKYYRNRITFRVGNDEDKIELIDHLQYYEIQVYPTDSKARREPFQHCDVLETIESSICFVCNSMFHTDDFSTDALQIGFYCDCCPVHPVYFCQQSNHMSTRRIYCDVKGLTALSKYQKEWLKKKEEEIVYKEHPAGKVTTGGPVEGRTHTEAADVYVQFYDKLQNVNPDDISAKLFAKQLISERDKAEVDNQMLTDNKRVVKLLEAVKKAINIDPQKFEAFLEILGQDRMYQTLADEMREKQEELKKQCEQQAPQNTPQGASCKEEEIAKPAQDANVTAVPQVQVSSSQDNVQNGSLAVATSSSQQQSIVMDTMVKSTNQNTVSNTSESSLQAANTAQPVICVESYVENTPEVQKTQQNSTAINTMEKLLEDTIVVARDATTMSQPPQQDLLDATKEDQVGSAALLPSQATTQKVTEGTCEAKILHRAITSEAANKPQNVHGFGPKAKPGKTDTQQKSEKDRAHYAMKKCQDSLSSILDSKVNELERQGFISKEQVKQWRRSDPQKQKGFIFEAVKSATINTDMFNRLLDVLKDHKDLIQMLQKNYQGAK